MTTSPVMTVTDELLADLDLSVRAVWHDDDAAVVAVDALTAELRRLRADNAELEQSLAESRANDQAAMGWLTSLRWASGDRGERMLPELVAHIEGLAKDAGRYRWMRSVKYLSVTSDGSTWTSQDGRAYVSAHTLCANGSQYAGRETLSEAIDTAMATQ